MTSELIIDAQPKEVTIALMEDQRLVEFQREDQDSKFSVGNIYAARVKKIMPALNACFVEVGHEREAFLHYQDLGAQFLSLEKYTKQVISDRKRLAQMDKMKRQADLPKSGEIQSILEVGQEILVQITKEPISTKGPRLTAEISFPGRYLVLIPFEDKVSVSSKIKSSEERARLKQLIQSIKPKNFGVIVRTVAEGKRVAELDKEMEILLQNWKDCIVNLQQATDLPTLAHEETGRAKYPCQQPTSVPRGEEICFSHCSRTRKYRQTLQGINANLRQLQCHQANQVGVWQDSKLQKRGIPHHRTHRSTPCGGCQLRQP